MRGQTEIDGRHAQAEIGEVDFAVEDRELIHVPGPLRVFRRRRRFRRLVASGERLAHGGFIAHSGCSTRTTPSRFCESSRAR